VRRHDDGPTFVVQPAENIPQRMACLRVESDRRLIEKENRRLVDQRAADDQPLLLSAGELIDFRICAIGETKLIEQHHRFLGRRLAGHAEVRGMEDQVLDDVQSAVRIRALRNDSDASPDFDGIVDDVGSSDGRVARRRRDARRENAQRRRFAGAVRTE
jgi:hypothetical protein